MTEAIDAVLERIAARQRRWKEAVEAPAPEPAIARAEAYVHDHAQIPLPAALRDFWARRDGLDFNGLRIYRPTEDERDPYSPNLVEMNDEFAKVTGGRYLYIGDSDMDAFVHDRADGGWHAADKVSLDSFERYETCEALLVAVLEKYLGMAGG